MEKYLHPNVQSKITDLSEFTVTALGTTTGLAVITSDQGPDNKLVEVNSATEFTNIFGQPNFTKHGQTAYNTINFLNAGGKVHVLRVMPTDAKYSNLVLNVQTKKEGGKTLLRPVIGYIETASSELSLEASLTDNKFNGSETVDGFTNNLLMAFYPNGRGKAYDSLAIKFTLEDAYDDTYDFRVYNLGVYSKNSNGELALVEGPFTVALAPEAKTVGGDSLFIKTIVEKYSKVLRVKFNEEAYDKIGEQLNKFVDPKKLDMLFGVQKYINEQPEVYFNEDESKEKATHEDIVFDTVADSSKENIELENDKVKAKLSGLEEAHTEGVKVMKGIKANTYINDFNSNYKPETTSLTSTYESTKTLLDSAVDALAAKSTDDLTTTLSELVQVSTDSNTIIEEMRKVYDALKKMILGIKPATKLVLGSDLDKIDKTIVKFMEGDFKLQSIVAKIYELKETVEKAKEKPLLSNFDIKDVALTLKTVKETVLEIDSTLTKESDLEKFMTELKQKFEEQYVIVEKALVVIEDKYSNADEISAKVTEAKEAIKVLFVKTEVMLEMLTLDNRANLYLTYAMVEGTELPTMVKTNLVTALDGLYKASDDEGTLHKEMSSAEGRARLAEYALEYITELEESISNEKLVMIDFGYSVIGEANFLKLGSNGNIDFDTVPTSERLANIDSLRISAFKGGIDGAILDENQIYLDVVIDAGYSTPVKNALVELCTQIRKDFFLYLDMGTSTINPDDALNMRKDSIQVNDFKVGVFTQHFVVEDAEYTKNDIKVASTYFLAGKVPSNDDNFGMHYPLAGVRRGTITGFKSLSWRPNPNQKEKLYKKQINYVETDNRTTKFATQKTSQLITSALSNINNVRVLLKIQKDVNEIMKDFLQEFNDATTMKAANNKLTNYLKKWITNRACTSIKGEVYASEYDKIEGTLRVKIEIIFNKVIERIMVDLVVKG